MALIDTTKKNQAPVPATKINNHYFSGVQTSLFIGDVWIDDISSIEYAVRHSREPIYGYGSQHFDFLPKGNILVTGSFIINFREPNYLWIILERYKKFNQSREQRLIEGKKLDLAELSNTYAGDERQRFNDFFNEIDPATAKGRLLEQSREFNGIAEPDSGENLNHEAFDILIGYGAELGPESPGETISSVHVMGKGKVIQIDGRPVQEQYQFIARRIK